MAAPIRVDVSHKKSEKNDISDMFKESFKFYKRKKPPPDFSNVIDFDDGSVCSASKIVPFSLLPSEHNVCGVKPVHQWKAFTLQHVPGFVFIRNPFTVSGQRYWVERCLRHYHCKPYVTNLDKHFTVTGNLWEDYKKPVKNVQSRDKPLMDRLRWATMGYHHDWDTKHYRADHQCPMPEEMVKLCRHVAATVAYPHYLPQAAIVNYYHMDSTLAGHTDHSEYNLEAPLVSISFGQTAIFLLGGLSKSQRPHAIYLHSGDIVIMMKESRLAYHGVPRIVPDKHGLPLALTTHEEDQEPEAEVPLVHQKSKADSEAEECKTGSGSERDCENEHCEKDNSFSADTESEETVNERIASDISALDWTEYAEYMKTCRLNLNVRQVLSPGESFPSEIVQHESCKRSKVS